MKKLLLAFIISVFITAWDILPPLPVCEGCEIIYPVPIPTVRFRKGIYPVPVPTVPPKISEIETPEPDDAPTFYCPPDLPPWLNCAT